MNRKIMVRRTIIIFPQGFPLFKAADKCMLSKESCAVKDR